MKKVLDFVKGAVSTKDLHPVLTNFRFYNGRVQGGNGRIAIDAPLDLGGIDITVPAVPFIRAIEACGGDPELNITKGGRLIVKKDKFKSLLPLSDNASFPLAKIDEFVRDKWQPSNGLVKVLKTIRSFIGEDASRPWACGVLFKEGFLYATNNVVIVRVPYDMPEHLEINIPSYTIDELIRVNKDPIHLAYTESAVLFGYGQSWMRSHLFDTKWPDVDKFFEGHDVLQLVPGGLLSAVEKILPFCPDSKFPVIRLDELGVHTAEGDMSADVGGLALPDSRYRAEPLQMVLRQATRIDLTKYPGPVPFAGDNRLQGILVGVK